jgi:hypothetical protein
MTRLNQIPYCHSVRQTRTGAWAHCASASRTGEGKWCIKIAFIPRGKSPPDETRAFSSIEEVKRFVSEYFGNASFRGQTERVSSARRSLISRWRKLAYRYLNFAVNDPEGLRPYFVAALVKKSAFDCRPSFLHHLTAITISHLATCYKSTLS